MFQFSKTNQHMKKIIMILMAVGQFVLASAQGVSADKRVTKMGLTATELAHYMAPGINLGNTMEACDYNDLFTNKAGVSSETSWQSDKTSEGYIASLKERGFNSLRIPCGWVAGHIVDKDKLTIDPAWVKRIREIVDACLRHDLVVIINHHWDGGWMEHDAFTDQADVAAMQEQYRKLWTNIALAFKDYDERVLFAGLNEPGVGGASPQAKGKMMEPNTKEFADRILAFEQIFINTVRATGGKNAKRVLIVQGPKTEIDLAFADNFNFYSLQDKAKNRLMAEVHFYDPYTFTQMMEDADWGKVSIYWKGHAPADDKGRTTNNIWYNNQNLDAEEYVEMMMGKMKTKFVDKGVPVIVGEYGANRKNATNYGGDQAKHDESMEAWYREVTSCMMKAGLVPYVWDINVQPLPHMTIFDRRKQSVSDSYIYKGVMEGAREGMEDFLKAYPGK